jgi:hypothetical protein
MKSHRRQRRVVESRATASASFIRSTSDQPTDNDFHSESRSAWADEWVESVVTGRVALHYQNDRCVAGAIVQSADGPALCITILNTANRGMIYSMTQMRDGADKDPATVRNYLLSKSLNAETGW